MSRPKFPEMPLLDPKRNQKVFTVEQIFDAFLKSATDQSNGAVQRSITHGRAELAPLILLGQMGAATELWLGISKHLGIEGEDGPYVDKPAAAKENPHMYVNDGIRMGCTVCGLGVGAYVHNDEARRKTDEPSHPH